MLGHVVFSASQNHCMTAYQGHAAHCLCCTCQSWLQVDQCSVATPATRCQQKQLNMRVNTRRRRTSVQRLLSWGLPVSSKTSRLLQKHVLLTFICETDCWLPWTFPVTVPLEVFSTCPTTPTLLAWSMVPDLKFTP